MRDGYCGLYDGENEEEARQQAMAAATHAIDGAAMTPGERREAVTVDSVECLTPAHGP